MTEVPFVGFSVGIIRDKWNFVNFGDVSLLIGILQRTKANYPMWWKDGFDTFSLLVFFQANQNGFELCRIFKVSFKESFGSIIHHKTGKWKVTHKTSGGFCDQIVVTFTRNIGLSSNYLFPMWESHETYQNEFINIQKWTRITFKYDNLTK